jgi:RNA polymerase sigma-70 factor (ECF subfamily)
MAEKKSPDIAQWVENYTSDLYAWARYKLSDEELAKDLVQDTFMAAAEKTSSFKGESSPKTYLFSILNHKIIDHYRKKSIDQ